MCDSEFQVNVLTGYFTELGKMRNKNVRWGNEIRKRQNILYMVSISNQAFIATETF